MKVVMGRSCFGWTRRKKVTSVGKGRRSFGYSASTVGLLPPAEEIDRDHKRDHQSSSAPASKAEVLSPGATPRMKFGRCPFITNGSSKRRVRRWKQLRLYYAGGGDDRRTSSSGTATASQQIITQNSTQIDSTSLAKSEFHREPTKASSEMDPKIWNALPEELLDRILSVVSLKTLLKLRSTCKRFETLFLSPSFISNYNSTPHNNPSHSQPISSFLLLSHPHFGRHRFAVYDSLRRRWRNSPLPVSAFLPKPPSVATARRGSSASPALLTSSKGILCFSRPSSPSSFLICNFLTKSTRVIKFPNHPFPTDSLTIIPTQSSGYKIFALSRGISSKSSFLYDSALRRWHQSDEITPNFRSNSRREGVVHNDSLYFHTADPYSIVRYDLEQRRWDDGGGELVLLSDDAVNGGRLSFVRLAGDGERKMYLIGGVAAAAQWILSGVKVWELDDGGGRRRNCWVELGSLPAEMCRKFVAVCYHNYEHVYCFWHGGRICLCCYTWPEILWYDVAAGEWGWLPKCPLLPEKGNCGFSWFSVVSQFYNLV